jgi:hypothetical protein
MPGRLKVGDHSKGKKLETHFDGENYDIEVIESFHDPLPHGRFLQSDILESKSQTGCHDQEKDSPLEGPVFNDPSYSSTEPRTADTERSAADHAALTAVIATVTVMSLVLIYTRYTWR